MSTSADASAAADGGASEVWQQSGAAVPSLDRLREALRPPSLPLPAPRSVRGAAHRIQDLVHAERFAEARLLAAAYRDRRASLEDRFALARADVLAHPAASHREEWGRAVGRLLDLLEGAGYSQQALATAQVVQASAASARRVHLGRPGTTGRRRSDHADAPPAMLAVVRALEEVPLGVTVDPCRESLRLQGALRALDEVQADVLGDARTVLTARLAQALEGAGQHEAAASRAYDVLDATAIREAEGEDADPDRAATSAHAVLARCLSTSRPLEAIDHSLRALEQLQDVDDPPLRIGIATDMLQTFTRENLHDHGQFAAGRLVSLQRSLVRDAHRVRPLLAIAAQRAAVQRYEAALVPLREVRRIAAEQRNRRASFEASRLLARIAQENGRQEQLLLELRRAAADARWVADDLETVGPERAAFITHELKAQALVLRYALEAGQRREAVAAAAAIERRTRPGEGMPALPLHQLWDYRVDAMIGRMVAAGTALAAGEDGATAEDYAQARRAALEAIDQVPAGHEARACFWAAYIQDRHALMLRDRGDARRAQRAAMQARDAWEAAGESRHRARMEALLAELIELQRTEPSTARASLEGADPRQPIEK